MISSGVADVSKFTVKRKFEDFGEDDLYQLRNLFNQATVFGEEGEIFFPAKSEPPSFIATIIRQCKALFNIKEEVESIQVTIFPCADSISKKEHKIKKTNLNIASRVVICVGHREIFNIHVSGAGFHGDGKLLTCNGDAFQIVMGACAVADLTYDDSTSSMIAPKPNWRVKPYNKNPLQRYIIVVDGVVDANVLVKSIKKELGTESTSTNDVDELLREVSVSAPAPTCKVQNEDDD